MNIEKIKEQAHAAVDLMIDELLKEGTSVNDQAITLQMSGNEFMKRQVALHQVNAEISLGDIPVCTGPNYVFYPDLLNEYQNIEIKVLSPKELVTHINGILNSDVDNTSRLVRQAYWSLTTHGFTGQSVKRIVSKIQTGKFIDAEEIMKDWLNELEKANSVEVDTTESLPEFNERVHSHNQSVRLHQLRIDRAIIEFYQMNRGSIPDNGVIPQSDANEIIAMAREDGVHEDFDIGYYILQYNRQINLSDRPQITLAWIDRQEQYVDQQILDEEDDVRPEVVRIDADGNVANRPVTGLTAPGRRTTAPEMLSDRLSDIEIIERMVFDFARENPTVIVAGEIVRHNYINIVEMCDVHGVTDVPLIHEHLDRMNHEIANGTRESLMFASREEVVQPRTDDDERHIALVRQILNEHTDDDTEDAAIRAITRAVPGNYDTIMEDIIVRFYEDHPNLQREDGIIDTETSVRICRRAEREGINYQTADEFIGERNAAINDWNNPTENEPAVADELPISDADEPGQLADAIEPDTSNPFWTEIDIVFRALCEEQEVPYGNVNINGMLEMELRRRCDNQSINFGPISSYILYYQQIFEHPLSHFGGDTLASQTMEALYNPDELANMDQDTPVEVEALRRDLVDDEEEDPGVTETRRTARFVENVEDDNPYWTRIDTQVRDYFRSYDLRYEEDAINNLHRTNIIDRCDSIGIPFEFIESYIREYNDRLVF